MAHVSIIQSAVKTRPSGRGGCQGKIGGFGHLVHVSELKT